MLSAIVSQTVKEDAKGPHLALLPAVAALQVSAAHKVCCFRSSMLSDLLIALCTLLESCCQSDSDAQKLTISSQDRCCIGPRPCCTPESPNTECHQGRSFCRLILPLERWQVLILWLQRMTAAPTAPREVCQNVDRRVPFPLGQLLKMKTVRSLPPWEAIVALTVT
jgi:hypothetical protein